MSTLKFQPQIIYYIMLYMLISGCVSLNTNELLLPFNQKEKDQEKLRSRLWPLTLSAGIQDLLCGHYATPQPVTITTFWFANILSHKNNCDYQYYHFMNISCHNIDIIMQVHPFKCLGIFGQWNWNMYNIWVWIKSNFIST